MAEEEEGPRTVRLDPSQLPGGSRFTPPVIPDGPAMPADGDPPESPSAPADTNADATPSAAATAEGTDLERNAQTRIAPLPSDLMTRLAQARPTSGPARGSATPTAPGGSASVNPPAPPGTAKGAAPVAGTPSAPAVQSDSRQNVVQKPPITPAPSARTDQTAVHQSPVGPAAVDRTAVSPPRAPTPPSPTASSNPAPNAGKASVPTRPTSAPPAARAAARVPTRSPMADPDLPTVARPGWTVEPGWSAYANGVPPQAPEQAPSFDAPSGPSSHSTRPPANPAPSVHRAPPQNSEDSVEHTSSLAGALLGSTSAKAASFAQPEPEPSNRRTVLIVAIVLIVAVAVGAGVAMLAGDTIMSVLDGVLS